MNKLLIIKAGDSLPDLVKKRGDFDDWILAGLGINQHQSLVVSTHQDQVLPDPTKLSGVIISGSPIHVSADLPWIARTEAWLCKAIDLKIPLLGICFGHQLIAQALGGIVADTPAGLEIGTVRVNLNQEADKDLLFRNMPKEFYMQSSHYQAVIELPSNSTVLASTESDPHAVIRFSKNTWGVQFHPEFDAEITRAYISNYQDRLIEHNRDPHRISETCRDTPQGKLLLKLFQEVTTTNPNN
jgi:GMP synthase (glutamine-hydrolysing)